MNKKQRSHLKPLAVALAIACAGTAGIICPQPGYAQQIQAFNIPSGPLAPALRSFAKETGLLLTFNESQTANKTTAGVQGSFSSQEALKALLHNTGLQAVQVKGGSFVLQTTPDNTRNVTLDPVKIAGNQADDTDSVALAPVKVKAKAERDGTTEGSGSYTTRASTAATKLNLSPRETPQTLTVVTRQKMDDFGLTTVDKVLESTSGVTIINSGNTGNTAYSRGFTMQSQYDGIPNPIGIGESNSNPSPDSAFLDRVEILQGASGLLTGAGEPGGTINLVRKRPTDAFQASVEGDFGSWDKKRFVGDISGSLFKSPKIRGRAVLLWDESDSFTNHVNDDKKGLYGVIDADVTSSTTVGASIQWQQNDGNDHSGLPFARNGSDLNLPRSAFFGGADDGIKKKYWISTITFKQQLPSDWLLQASYSHNQTDVDTASSYLGGTLNTTTGDGLSLRQQLVVRDFSSDSYDLYANGPVTILGRRHELAFGINGSEMKDRTKGYWNVVTPINVYSFNGDIPRPSNPLRAWSSPNETSQWGVFGVARVNITDSLKLILGTRMSWYEYKAAGIQTQKENAVVTPYAGLVYDLNKSLSVYASYSDIFKPQSNVTSSGTTVKPITGNNYEMGVKGEFLDGRLNTAAALFWLEQTNLAETDYSSGPTACNGGYCYTPAGLVISRGGDLTINGEILPGLQLGAGYTYVHSKYQEGEKQGEAYATKQPDHIFRLFSSYKLPDTNLTLGGNIRAQSKVYHKSTYNHIEQGSYMVVGLMAKYKLSKQAELGITVDNLFDRRYYTSVGYENAGNFYGTPRSFMTTLKYTF